MANTYTQLVYHLVFSTRNRMPVLIESGREELFRYFWGIHKSLKCHLYRIGGVEDHVHILTSLPTTLSVAEYLQEIKTGTSAWITN
jgi:REP element-mobilizing transposase RayT